MNVIVVIIITCMYIVNSDSTSHISGIIIGAVIAIIIVAVIVTAIIVTLHIVRKKSAQIDEMRTLESYKSEVSLR